MNNKEILLNKVRKLYTAFQQGEIKTLSQHEVNPGLNTSSRENYLYFTLPVCLNFQRSSPAMWVSALATYTDMETNYVFSPEKVTAVPREKVKADLVKHKLALQPNKHTDIWLRISTTLHEVYNDDPREILKAGSWDIVNILAIIQKERRQQFPYLSGPKMANYWLYILHHFTDAQFANMQALSIIPDTHVLKSTVQLGLLSALGTPETTANVWRELLTGSELAPVDMHPVLWNWSRNNFIPEV